MKYVTEYRKKTIRPHKPILLEGPGRVQYNFQSIYKFPETTADFIKTNGNTKNLKGMPVFSDKLFIDIDEDKNVNEALKIIKDLNIAYSVWNTGGRGRHIHINIQPMSGVNVVYSQRLWLEQVGLWELIDTSIYREGGIIRTPGAVHQRTGGVMVCEEQHEGTTLTIRTLTPPPVVHSVARQVTGSVSAEFDFFMNLLAKKDCGLRHTHMYILWNRGIEAGYSEEEVADAIHWWNNRQDQPHTYAVVEQKLKGFK
jgi:hypothetical protein